VFDYCIDTALRARTLDGDMCNTENERKRKSNGVVSSYQSRVDQLGISSKHSIFASRGQLAPIRGVALSFNITKHELRKTCGFRSNVSH